MRHVITKNGRVKVDAYGIPDRDKMMYEISG